MASKKTVKKGSDREPVRRRCGFTLLELLLVVTILAIIAGSVITAYDGLEEKAAKGQAAYGIGGLDSAIRTYRSMNETFPNEFDSLMWTDGTNFEPLNILPAKLQGTAASGDDVAKAGPWTLTQAGVDSLRNAGVTRLRYVQASLPLPGGGTKTYDNTATVPEIPTRVFDEPEGEGWGAAKTIVAGDVVVALNGLGVTDFDGNTPLSDARNNKVANLDPDIAHLVVVFGIGNNCTLIDKEQGRLATLSEAPSYSNVLPGEYARYLAMFHLATDGANGGTVNDTFEAAEYLPAANFLGVVATDVDHLDEEKATSGL